MLSKVLSIFRKLPFTVALTILSVLFLLPQQYLEDEIFDWWDKAQHASAFAFLLLVGVLSHPAKLMPVFWGLLVYGGLIEIIQSFSGWREGDVLDWAADCTGVLIGYGLISFIRSRSVI